MAATWKQLFKRTEWIINMEGLEERVQQWRVYSWMVSIPTACFKHGIISNLATMKRTNKGKELLNNRINP